MAKARQCDLSSLVLLQRLCNCNSVLYHINQFLQWCFESHITVHFSTSIGEVESTNSVWLKRPLLVFENLAALRHFYQMLLFWRFVQILNLLFSSFYITHSGNIDEAQQCSTCHQMVLIYKIKNASLEHFCVIISVFQSAFSGQKFPDLFICFCWRRRLSSTPQCVQSKLEKGV